MSDLPLADGETHLNVLRTHVLLPMFGIQHRTQHQLLPLPATAKPRPLHPLHIRRKPHQWVLNCLCRVLAPRSNEIFKYLCRTTDTTEWINRRELKNLKAGLVVDFQDAFRVWRRAIVLKTFVGKTNKLMVSLKSFFKGSEILETVEASSKRLAPLNFFTRSKYLEDFSPVLPELDIYEK